MTKKQPKHPATRKHHKAILKAMRELLSLETWKTTLGDDRMAAMISDKGVYCTHQIIRDVRLENAIPTAYERQMSLFAKSKGK